MGPNAGDRPRSPIPKRLHVPLPPSPHRTTSQISNISVQAHPNDESASRQLLSQTINRSRKVSEPPQTDHSSFGPSTPAKSSQNANGTGCSSEGSSINWPHVASGSSTPAYSPEKRLGSTSGRSTPGMSRKGKERALVVDDAEVEQVDVSGEMVMTPQGEGSAAKGLRELVRRSTVGEESRAELGQTSSRAASIRDQVHTLEPPSQRTYSTRRYYVLTHAGKPVFSSHDDASEENLTNLMGVAQALISIFAEDDDRLRCIVKGRHRIAFVLKAPLYLFCVSDWGEPEHVLRVHLEYIHLQILSVVTSSQLSRVFQRRSNFDLSRLLEGTENFLHSLINTCQTDFSFLTSTLQPLRMAPALRDTAATALMPPSRFKDLLYVLLIAGGHIVTLLRPRKHSIHPSDLHLLLNTLATSSTLRTTETWFPMCFPKFNPAGFVHAFVSFILVDVGLVFVSADKEAYTELGKWKEIVLEKLEKDKTLAKIEASIPHHAYSVSVLACPGLRHFVYKSRQNVQVTSPMWEAPYEEDGVDRKRLVTLYQQLHDTVHARSGQSASLRLVYMRTDHEAVLAWVTKPFELYLTTTPHLSKAAVVAAANTVARWVGVEEGKLFLKDAPVF